jgi:hypothetical protein
MGYQILDLDRDGDKGFRRIDVGFSTRPDSRAMADHFRQRGDENTASKFRPSSMEFVRSLGRDPLTLVSEMPLFLVATGDEAVAEGPVFEPGSEGRRRLHSWLQELIAGRSPEAARGEAERCGVRGMPISDQMRLQLAFLNEALSAVAAR